MELDPLSFPGKSRTAVRDFPSQGLLPAHWQRAHTVQETVLAESDL
jgi:hypothetical protein